MTYPAARRTRFGAADATFRASPYRRTWALAKRLRKKVKTPYAYILAVNAYLSKDFTYSERPTPPAAGRAPLDAFLFDTKEGYCQHFAGAMALLLRMGGVPARVATGFSPGGFSKRRDAWIVRDTDAHAWVEAWFDDLGWVTFDPTPDATPARSQIAALQAAPPSAATPAGGGSAPPGPRRPGRAPAERRPARSAVRSAAQEQRRRGGRRRGQRDGMVALRAARPRRARRWRGPDPVRVARARPRADVAARPRGVGARGRPAACRAAAGHRHAATPARAALRRHRRGERIPARTQRFALRPEPPAAHGGRAPLDAPRARAGPRLGRLHTRVLGAAAAPLRLSAARR